MHNNIELTIRHDGVLAGFVVPEFCIYNKEESEKLSATKVLDAYNELIKALKECNLTAKFFYIEKYDTYATSTSFYLEFNSKGELIIDGKPCPEGLTIREIG